MFKKNVSLKEYTTLKMGGSAEFFVVVGKEDELEKIVEEIKNYSFRVLGQGSNVLIPDDGLDGVTIKNEIKGIEEKIEGNKVFVTAGAGVIFDELVEYCVDRSYWGLENLSHIPGTVGAVPVQNVGAYGVEVADLIDTVRVYDTTEKKFIELKLEDCKFGYRDSVFKKESGKRYIICSVKFRLNLSPDPKLDYRDLTNYFKDQTGIKISDIRKAVIEIRSNKFPDWRKVGTAGSFFKNPIVSFDCYEDLKKNYPDLPAYKLEDGSYKLALGWILDNVCDLRGVTKGSVGTYDKQALVLISTETATSAEIEEFANFIIVKVFEATGIKIDWEVTKLK